MLVLMLTAREGRLSSRRQRFAPPANCRATPKTAARDRSCVPRHRCRRSPRRQNRRKRCSFEPALTRMAPAHESPPPMGASEHLSTRCGAALRSKVWMARLRVPNTTGDTLKGNQNCGHIFPRTLLLIPTWVLSEEQDDLSLDSLLLRRRKSEPSTPRYSGRMGRATAPPAAAPHSDGVEEVVAGPG